MRRQRRTSGFFLRLTLNSFVAIVSIFAVLILFAKTFGELALPAIHMVTGLLWIPILLFLIGILGLAFGNQNDGPY